MKKYKIKKIINILFLILLVFSLGIFSYSILKVNILPIKYLVFGFIIIGIFTLIILWMMFYKKKKVISFILTVILSCILLFFVSYFNNTYHFLKGTQGKHDTLTYSVVVLKDSGYDDIKALNNQKISYLEDNYTDNIKKELSSIITYTESLVSEFGVLPELLLNQETEAIVLEESYLLLIGEEVENFNANTKVIYTFKVIVDAHKEETIDINPVEEPFILYISGIDQYGDVNTVRGRSDVNQIAVINPKTNHILLVNTPRDYYVQLAGTTGLKDKLTHAGIYGIDKSVATLENLYDIDINYYLRVNFNTLIKVVDIIGGIEVYSDTEFNSSHIKGWHVNKGVNYLDGAKALAYSRERYAYITGDHHRGANQQQVITAIIEKVTKSSVLISKYNSILNSLNGTFQTDIPMDEITTFIRYQLDKMPNWNIESIAVTGSNSMDYTYSMGTGYRLYVMEPDYNSVNVAKNRIQQILQEK